MQVTPGEERLAAEAVVQTTRLLLSIETISKETKTSYGISKLSLIQLILPYEISCIRDSLEIPLLSLL